MIAPGISVNGAEQYHADDCGDTPTLSASIANILIGRSPAHARAAHPKLNPDLERKDESKFDLGTAAHKLFLEGEDCMEVWAGKQDWRSGDAKAFRDEMRSRGKTPLLIEQAGSVRSMVAEALSQIDKYKIQPKLFTEGKPEATLVWEDEHDVVCRARLDWLRDDYSAIDDYKTTSASADPRKWERTMYGIGADVQVAFYMRGVERITGVRPSFRYVVQETYPPYELSVVGLAPSALALAEDKVEKALALWATCLERDFWPGYPAELASIEVPTWEETRWLERTSEDVV
jgi:hypothetical protein